MANLYICCLSDLVNDECHTKRFRANNSQHKTNTLSKEELEFLHLRVPNLKDTKDKSICDYHYKRYLLYYSSVEEKCCDPWKTHSKKVQLNLKIVDLKLSKAVKKCCNLSIVPGKKVCFNCNNQLLIEMKNYEQKYKFCIDPFHRHRRNVDSYLCCLEQQSIDYLKDVYNMEFSLEHKICRTCNNQLCSDIIKYKKSVEAASEHTSLLTNIVSQQSNNESNMPEFTQTSSDLEFRTLSQKKRKLDDILDTFGLPPFKRQKLNDDRTVEEGIAIVQNVVNQVSEAFEIAHEVKLPKFENIKQFSDKSSWFEKMILNIQAKFNASSTTFDEKIALLTLLPDDWKFVQIKTYFQCTAYMITEARKLKENIGKRRLRRGHQGLRRTNPAEYFFGRSFY